METQAPIRTRIFWTWDHATTWALNRAGGHDMGASNEYGRAPEAFLADYTCLLRWCGQHGIDGVVVWGLLRDRHGGADAVHGQSVEEVEWFGGRQIHGGTRREYRTDQREFRHLFLGFSRSQ